MSENKRKDRKPDELIKASDCLHYELNMLEITCRTLSTGCLGSSPARDAFVESFRIHVRCLYEFAYAEKSHPDDVIAGDYFSDRQEWINIRGKVPDSLGAVANQINKGVAHLSYERLLYGPERKKWNHEEITRDLVAAIRKFVEEVDENLLGDKLKQFKGTKLSKYEEASTPTIFVSIMECYSGTNL